MFRVLIVEDNDASRIALRHIIEKRFQFAVDEARNGVEGLSKFAENKPQLILLDIAMPIMNGKEFLQALRADDQNKDVQIIVLTAYGDKELVREMIGYGVSDYILKPFEKAHVIERVKSIAEKYDAEVEAPEGTEKKPAVAKVKEKRPKRILIAEHDNHFRQYFVNLLGKQFEVSEGTNGAESLQLFVNQRPHVVIIGSNLSVINEMMLAKKISDISSGKKPAVFFCNEDNQIPEGKEDLFTGSLKKSFVPEVFIKEFAAKILKTDTLYDLLRSFVSELEYEFSLAVQQVLGKEESSKVIELDKKYNDKITLEVFAVVDTIERRERFKVSFFLLGPQKDLVSITKPNYTGTLDVDKGVIEALSEHVIEISRKIGEKLKEKGFLLEQDNVRVKFVSRELEAYDMIIRIPFKAQNAQRFIAAISVVQTASS